MFYDFGKKRGGANERDPGAIQKKNAGSENPPEIDEKEKKSAEYKQVGLRSELKKRTKKVKDKDRREKGKRKSGEKPAKEQLMASERT